MNRTTVSPIAPPTICANTKTSAAWGAIPAKVSLNIRAKVNAGLTKAVDAVNQYAAKMYPATVGAMLFVCPVRTRVNTTIISPAVEIISEMVVLVLSRSLVENVVVISKMVFASRVPQLAPVTCAAQ